MMRYKKFEVLEPFLVQNCSCDVNPEDRDTPIQYIKDSKVQSPCSLTKIHKRTIYYQTIFTQLHQTIQKCTSQNHKVKNPVHLG